MGIAKGTTVWFVPIRYWETTEPEEATIIEHNSETKSLYVHHHGYGHSVYMPKDTYPFTNKAKAAKAIDLKTELYKLELADGAEYLSERILASVEAGINPMTAIINELRKEGDF